MLKKKVKLYLHHSHYEPVSYKKRTGVFGVAANIIVGVCYGAGWTVLNLVLLPYTLYKTFRDLDSRPLNLAQKIHSPRFRKTVAVFALLAIVTAGSVHGLSLIAAGQNIKGEVLGASDTGLQYLQDAKTALDAQNTEAAQVNLGKALEQFRDSQETLNSTSVILKGLLAVVPQKQDADAMLSAAELITQAGLKGTQLLELTNTMKISAIGLDNAGKNAETLQQIQALLTDTVNLATEAAKKIDSVSINSIPENYRASFMTAKDAAALFQDNVSALKEVSSLLFDLVLGQKNVLIVFQNNNELRASGGFMGTIGSAVLQDGSLNSLDIRSVYDWDGQLKEKILPPQPMFAVNNQWYMRDSNWFASFPESASRISSLYEKEGGETPDLIVAMTPEVILDMLAKTGPIYLPQHDVTLTTENFVEQTQVETSINYDKTLNQPKQFLADFFPILMDKIGDNGGLMAFLEIFQRNLYKKNILLYSRNSDIEQKISAFNWGGELRPTDRDFLSIVNTNLGGTKTDRNILRSINLQSKIAADGTITNTLTYEAKNQSLHEALNNKSFIRFYVPLGSKLVSTDGFNNDIVLPRISEDGYVIDEAVRAWQKDVTQDTVSGTFLGREAGKTWFGNWLDVPAGQTKTVTLTYTLPFRLENIDRHSLLIQKQPGSMTGPLNYSLDFTGRGSLWNSGAAQIDGNTLNFKQDLTTDLFVGLVTEKR